MEANKQVAADQKELMLQFLPFLNDYTTMSKPHEPIRVRIEKGMKIGRAEQCALIAEGYAALSNQQLQHRIDELEYKLTSIQVERQQLTAENEALQKRLEENRKSFRADLHHLRKHKAKLKAENERLREAQRWIPVTERLPEDGKVYDIVIYWPDKATPDKREGYIFKEKSFPEEKPMFQEASCFGMGLYELTFFLSENLVTHYREWTPLPNKPETKSKP